VPWIFCMTCWKRTTRGHELIINRQLALVIGGSRRIEAAHCTSESPILYSHSQYTIV
jgi:hypothetical protein